MTDTTEAVRLADDLAPIAGLMPGGNIAKVVALLRRIPELEAGMQEQAEKIKQQALQIISLDGQAQVLQEERAELENRFNWMPLPTQGSAK